MSFKMKPADVRALVDEEAKYWDDKKEELQLHRDLYMCEYWKEHKVDNGNVRVETSAVHQRVSSRVGALFPRAPSVDVQPDIRADAGDCDKAKLLVNRFLSKQRGMINLTTVNALLFPFAVFKMTAKPSADPYERVALTFVLPWDLIVDKTALSWETQRYVGHKYMLQVDEAKERFGAKDYTPVEYTQFIETKEDDNSGSRLRPSTFATSSDINKFIEVVELYDLCSDRLLYWSPQYANGEKWLATKTKIEVEEGDEGEEGSTDGSTAPSTLTFDGIPFRDSLDQPKVPLIPMYLESDPTAPMRGYSYVKRFADQASEQNALVTAEANFVRKTVQQFAAAKGAMDPDAISNYESANHGAVIEFNIGPGEDIRNVMAELPQARMPTEMFTYGNELSEAMDAASVVSPQARGEVMNVTAREVDALAAQASSQIGSMAVVRDNAIEQMAEMYLIITKALMGDDDARMVNMDGKLEVVKYEDLDGAFKYTAHDLGAGPMAEKESLKEFTGMAMSVMGLPNIDKDAVVKAILERNKLPAEWLKPMAVEGGGAAGMLPPVDGVLPPTPDSAIVPGQ